MTHQNRPQQTDQKFFKDQIITTDDLMAFKEELIREIKNIVTELNDKGGRKWLRSGEVCKALSISHGTLQNLRIHGHLPFNKVGGTIFYDRKDINAMLDANRIDNHI
jgi:hypothetical protein